MEPRFLEYMNFQKEIVLSPIEMGTVLRNPCLQRANKLGIHIDNQHNHYSIPRGS